MSRGPTSLDRGRPPSVQLMDSPAIGTPSPGPTEQHGKQPHRRPFTPPVTPQYRRQRRASRRLLYLPIRLAFRPLLRRTSRTPTARPLRRPYRQQMRQQAQQLCPRPHRLTCPLMHQPPRLLSSLRPCLPRRPPRGPTDFAPAKNCPLIIAASTQLRPQLRPQPVRHQGPVTHRLQLRATRPLMLRALLQV